MEHSKELILKGKKERKEEKTWKPFSPASPEVDFVLEES